MAELLPSARAHLERSRGSDGKFMNFGTYGEMALVEPSHALPFLEPFLPYYDPIRDEPEFIELLAELDVSQSGR